MPVAFVQHIQVIDSGQVVSRGLETIELHPFQNGSYFVLMVFEQQTNLLAPITIANQPHPNGGGYVVTLQNFGLHPGGLGSTEPIHVANDSGKRVFLNFAVQTIGAELLSCTKIVSYTLTRLV